MFDGHHDELKSFFKTSQYEDEGSLSFLKINNAIFDYKSQFDLNILLRSEKKDFASNLENLCRLIYSTARYSLDLPFTASIAAHSFVFNDSLTYALKEEKLRLIKEKALTSNFVGSLCNSEYGSGSNLRDMNSCLTKENYFSIHKPHVTNGSIADYGIFSLYDQKVTQKIAIYLIDLSDATKTDLNPSLSCFNSGGTGGVKVTRKLDLDRDIHMSETIPAFSIIKRCFDSERLILGVMAAGVLKGIEDLLEQDFSMDSALSRKSTQYQYLQEKIVELIKTRLTLESLTEKVIKNVEYEFSEMNHLLSSIKIIATVDAHKSSLGILEMMGAKSTLKNNKIFKVSNDLLAYRFFGGTKELHKNVIFEDFRSKIVKKNYKKAV